MTFNPHHFTTPQTARAVEAIEDNAVAAIPAFGGAYQVVSSDGTASYLVDSNYSFCTCQARGRCYHQLAAYLYVEGLDALGLTSAA